MNFLRSIFLFLQRVIFWLRNHWVLFALSVIGCMALATIILTVVFPNRSINLAQFEKPAISGRIDAPNSQVVIQYIGSTEYPFDRLGIYRVQAHLNSKSLLPSLAQALNLTQSTFSPEVFVNDNKSITLTQTKGTDIAQYDNSQLSPKDDDLGIDLNAAQKASAEFLKNLGYDPSALKRLDDKTEFMANAPGEVHLEPAASIAEAHTVSFVYQRQLETLPVVIGGSEFNTLIVYVSKNGVFKAQLPSWFFATEKLGNADVFPLQTVLDNIQNGKYTVVNQLDSAAFDKTSLAKFTKMVLDNLSAEYRLDENQNTLFPYARLTGQLTLENQRTVPVEIITPMVKVAE